MLQSSFCNVPVYSIFRHIRQSGANGATLRVKHKFCGIVIGYSIKTPLGNSGAVLLSTTGRVTLA